MKTKVIGGAASVALAIAVWFGYTSTEDKSTPPPIATAFGAAKDRSAPSVVITSPITGSVVYGKRTVALQTTDNKGVVRLTVQEGTATICDLAKVEAKIQSWACPWDSWLDTDSATPRTLMATAYDGAGNTGKANVSVTSAPRLRIVPVTLPEAECGKPYRGVIQAVGAIPGTYKWRLDFKGLGLWWLSLTPEGDDAVLSGIVPVAGPGGEDCLVAQTLLARLREELR